jgi:hypothetical protein
VEAPPTTAAVLAAAIVAMVAGCGSSSGPSRADFVKRANAICKRVNDQIATAGQAKTVADVQRIGPAIIAAEQRGLADLRRLRVPASLTRDWQRLQSDLAQITSNAGRLLSAANAHDSSTAQTVANASQQTQTEITTIATRDGLGDCAKG